MIFSKWLITMIRTIILYYLLQVIIEHKFLPISNTVFETCDFENRAFHLPNPAYPRRLGISSTVGTLLYCSRLRAFFFRNTNKAKITLSVRLGLVLHVFGI